MLKNGCAQEIWYAKIMGMLNNGYAKIRYAQKQKRLKIGYARKHVC